MVDYGCGYGYSTIAFAMMVDSLLKYEGQRQTLGRLEIIGADVYQDFIEKSILNYQNYRSKIANDVLIGF